MSIPLFRPTPLRRQARQPPIATRATTGWRWASPCRPGPTRSRQRWRRPSRRSIRDEVFASARLGDRTDRPVALPPAGQGRRGGAALPRPRASRPCSWRPTWPWRSSGYLPGATCAPRPPVEEADASGIVETTAARPGPHRGAPQLRRRRGAHGAGLRRDPAGAAGAPAQGSRRTCPTRYSTTTSPDCPTGRCSPTACGSAARAATGTAPSRCCSSSTSTTSRPSTTASATRRATPPDEPWRSACSTWSGPRHRGPAGRRRVRRPGRGPRGARGRGPVAGGADPPDHAGPGRGGRPRAAHVGQHRHHRRGRRRRSGHVPRPGRRRHVPGQARRPAQFAVYDAPDRCRAPAREPSWPTSSGWPTAGAS